MWRGNPRRESSSSSEDSELGRRRQSSSRSCSPEENAEETKCCPRIDHTYHASGYAACVSCNSVYCSKAVCKALEQQYKLPDMIFKPKIDIPKLTRQRFPEYIASQDEYFERKAQQYAREQNLSNRPEDFQRLEQARDTHDAFLEYVRARIPKNIIISPPVRPRARSEQPQAGPSRAPDPPPARRESQIQIIQYKVPSPRSKFVPKAKKLSKFTTQSYQTDENVTFTQSGTMVGRPVTRSTNRSSSDTNLLQLKKSEKKDIKKKLIQKPIRSVSNTSIEYQSEPLPKVEKKKSKKALTLTVSATETQIVGLENEDEPMPGTSTQEGPRRSRRSRIPVRRVSEGPPQEKPKKTGKPKIQVNPTQLQSEGASQEKPKKTDKPKTQGKKGSNPTQSPSEGASQEKPKKTDKPKTQGKKGSNPTQPPSEGASQEKPKKTDKPKTQGKKGGNPTQPRKK
ncbi:unnamed protein product [Brassicogethes aeneus]|uniref:Uncharacterized protein n=1 Tax=Brassicogethes aeneus TaxID=1431903 RepID=A0A9P0BHR6_BRAAE|nr:unnamed protein product [Brassicogethes aeneus]